MLRKQQTDSHQNLGKYRVNFEEKLISFLSIFAINCSFFIIDLKFCTIKVKNFSEFVIFVQIWVNH